MKDKNKKELEQNQTLQEENTSKQKMFSSTDASLVFLFALVLPVIVMLFLSITLGKIATESVIFTALVPQLCFLGIYIFLVSKKKMNFFKPIGINKKFNILVLLCVLVIGLVAMFCFSPLIDLIDSITSSWGYHSSVSSIDVSTFAKFFGTIFYVALMPAICEELVFRGIITTGFKKFGMVTAVILSSVMFALMHQNLQQLVYQLFLGALMAYIMLKTGNIIYTMLLHFFNNFVILLLAHLSGSSSSTVDYSNAWNVIYPILLALLAVGVAIGLLFLMNFILKKTKPDSEEISQTENIALASNENENSQNNNLDRFFSIDYANQQTKFYKNTYVLISLAFGLLCWIFVVVNSFLA